MRTIQKREDTPRRLKDFAGAVLMTAGLMFATPAQGQNCPSSVVLSKAGRAAAARFERTVLAQDYSKVRRELGTTTDAPVEARTSVEITKQGRAKVQGLTFSCGRDARPCPEEIDIGGWNDDAVKGLRFPAGAVQTAEGNCVLQMSAYVPAIADLGVPKTRPMARAPEKAAPPAKRAESRAPQLKEAVSSREELRTVEEAEADVPQLKQFRLDRDGFISHVPTEEQRARIRELKREPEAPRRCTPQDMEKSGFTWMSWAIYKNKIRPVVDQLKKTLGRRLDAIRFRGNVSKGGAVELIGADGICGGSVCKTGRDPLIASGASAEGLTLSYSGSDCVLHFEVPLDAELTYRDFRDEKMLR